MEPAPSGAVSKGMGNARVLRVALIQSNRIVEDRTFSRRTRVTVGQRADNTFIVPADDAPSAQTVFDVSRRGYTLVFARGAEGRVAVGGVERTFAEVEASVSSTSGRCELLLDETSRGRVRIGDVALVFQFVDAPVAAPAVTLPAEARGSLLAQVDTAFLVVMGISLAAHFGAAGWLAAQPMPAEPAYTLEDLVQDRWAAQHLMPLPQPVAKPSTPARPVVPQAPSPAPTTPRPAVAARPASSSTPAGDLRSQVARLGVLGAIGREGVAGALGDVLSTSRGPDEVARALENASTLKVAAAGEDALQPRGPRAGETTKIGTLVTTAPTHEVRLKDQEHSSPSGPGESGGPGGIARPEKPQVETNEIPPDELNRWLRARTSAVQACYERELKRNHGLHGRLVVRFSITPRGRVEDLSFDEDTLGSAGVTSCIAGIAHGWVLPFTPPVDVGVSFPWVFAPAS